LAKAQNLPAMSVVSSPTEGEKRADPEDHSLFMVRSPCGRGGELLYVDFSELEDRQGGPIREE
jgi:hypothetical protein